MIYAVRYDPAGQNRQEDAKLQRLLSRALLARAMKRECGRTPQPEDFSFGPHGKPYLPGFGVQYNITNCPGLICCAVHDTEIGIDAETVRPFHQALANRVCTPQELGQIRQAEDAALQFIRFWTLKEGYLKYTGDGLGFGPGNVEFQFENGVPHKWGDAVCITQQLQTYAEKQFVISTFSKTPFQPEFHFYPVTDFINL